MKDKNFFQKKEKVLQRLRESASLKLQVADKCADEIVAAANLIADSIESGGKVLLCGNGGSAADCQHMATEFTSVLSKDFNRPGLPAISLTTDTSFITAFANDFGFEDVFAREVQALGRAGDVLILISTSGNSRNILQATKEARTRGIHTIGLTGEGGRLAKMVDIAIIVPSKNTQYIQESHCAIEHIISEITEEIFLKTLKKQKTL
ncbi:SIS domain-containing protein [Candidatus Roizmanbacteria bacterium]|nr:SIS domain-containing protein [Candidatus Roizmanbacteria bacterium]